MVRNIASMINSPNPFHCIDYSTWCLYGCLWTTVGCMGVFKYWWAMTTFKLQMNHKMPDYNFEWGKNFRKENPVSVPFRFVYYLNAWFIIVFVSSNKFHSIHAVCCYDCILLRFTEWIKNENWTKNFKLSSYSILVFISFFLSFSLFSPCLYVPSEETKRLDLKLWAERFHVVLVRSLSTNRISIWST